MIHDIGRSFRVAASRSRSNNSTGTLAETVRNEGLIALLSRAKDAHCARSALIVRQTLSGIERCQIEWNVRFGDGRLQRGDGGACRPFGVLFRHSDGDKEGVLLRVLGRRHVQ